MNNNMSEIERNNKSNKSLYVIIMILLFIIGVGVGYFVSNFKNDQSSQTLNTEKNNGVEENKKENKEIQSGILETDKSNSKEITIDGKNHTISYVEEEDVTGPGKYAIKYDERYILDWQANLNGISDVKYETFFADDNEYVLVTYSKWAEYGYILDENGNILKAMDYNNDAFECVMDIEESSKIYVENGIVYYYKYVEGSKKDDEEDNSIKMELFKIEIKNGKAVESSANKKVNGNLVNCA